MVEAKPSECSDYYCEPTTRPQPTAKPPQPTARPSYCDKACPCGCTPTTLGGVCKACPTAAPPQPTAEPTASCRYGLSVNGLCNGAPGNDAPQQPIIVSPTTVISPTQGACTKKAQGDANCDGVISLLDFEAWRSEFVGGATTKTADFNNDTIVNLLDYEIWRNTYTTQ